jgi:hypothetical protein
MTRLAVRVVLVVAVGGGCQPVKDVPDLLPAGPPAGAGAAVPAASDPAAKAFVEKAVKAFTGEKPELATKGLASRAVFKGRMFLPSESVPVDVTRTIAAVWPDRFVGTQVLQAQGRTTAQASYLRRPRLVNLRDGGEVPLPNPAEVERNFVTDETAQYWMALFVPLADPRAVAFDAHSTTGTTPQTGQPLPVQLLKLSLPDGPVYQLTFDEKTARLLRVEYAVTEQGVLHRRMWTVTEHKPGADGLTLPHKIEYAQDGRTAEQLEVEKWEFPATIPDAEFDPPKK